MLKSPSTKRFWFQSSVRSAHARIQLANAGQLGHPGSAAFLPQMMCTVVRTNSTPRVVKLAAYGVRANCSAGLSTASGSTISPTSPDGWTRLGVVEERQPLAVAGVALGDVRRDEPPRRAEPLHQEAQRRRVSRRTSWTANTSKCADDSRSARRHASRVWASPPAAAFHFPRQATEGPQVPAADQEVGAGPGRYARAYGLAERAISLVIAAGTSGMTQ